MKVRWPAVAVFLVLAYGLSGAIALGLHAAGFEVAKGAMGGPTLLALMILYMFTPLAATIITMRLVLREPVASNLRVRLRPNWWFAVALVVPLLLAFLTLGVGLLMPDASFSSEMGYLTERFGHLVSEDELEQMLAYPPGLILLMQVVSVLVAGATVNAAAAFGEELGWRGFLQREFAPLGFWRSSFLIGAIWGLWHAPVILQGYNYPNYPYLGVAMFTVFGAIAGPVISYVTVRARSVVAAAVMHGSLNAAWGISVLFIAGGSELTVGSIGLAGFIVYGLALAGAVFHDLLLAPERARFDS